MSNEVKPGSWIVTTADYGDKFDKETGEKLPPKQNFYIEQPSDKGLIAVVNIHSSSSRQEIIKTAGLLAAAPDLLHALKLVLSDNKLMNAMTREQSGAVLNAVSRAENSL